MSRGRRGAALAAAILLSLAAILLAHGALLLARQEAVVAGASRSVLIARAAAEYAVRRAVEEILAAPAADAPVLTAGDSVVGAVEGARYRGTVRRIGPGLWLAEGEGAAGVARSRVALPVRSPDPARLFGALGAVATVGIAPDPADAAGVDAAGFDDPTEPVPPGGCDSLAAPPVGPPVAAWRVDPRILAGDPSDPLDPETLARWIGRTVAGAGTPGPVERGATCIESEWNWGDPARRGGACEQRVPAVAVADGTVVTGGAGQALLVALGDVTISGASLYGGVIAAGRLRLERGTVLTGFARAAGGVELRDGSTVTGSRCWAMRALSVESLLVPAVIRGGGLFPLDR